ncbi:hypothetical protein [Oceanobacter sp. 4_MG-2023]|nr:hypothetical protein [Oceanobacter sp. 4_MG-2023]MDP2548901.1 hypothetical protein [Oceanobacter sp. 4_MG-2023]
MVLARLVWGRETSDPDEIAAAVWLHQSSIEKISDAVASGIAKAFAKK